MKIVALTSVSGPYIVARYAEFAQRLASVTSLTVIEFGLTSTTYQWEPLNISVPYQRAVLSNQPAEMQPIHALVKHLWSNLVRLDPQVLVIAGYAQPAMLAALLWARLHHIPAILLSETTETDFTRTVWREQIKQRIISQYQAALVGGQPQKRYLIKLGVPEKSIFYGYDIVGNDVFHPDRIQHLPSPHDRPYFLAINRFVTKKNLPVLINAYATYRQLAGDRAWDLVLCGDGQLRTQLEQQILDLNLTAHVHLPGFLQQDQLLPYFAHAQCFIHTSTHEQWGLVVNEAMAAGLPVLVSDRCGCVEDLLLEGTNGFSFDPYKPEELTRLMLRMSSSEIDRAAMGQAALQHIQQFSPSYFADGLMQAIAYTQQSRPQSLILKP
jgi:1,2-diacylglycerol 3-alpha-glucosyltransferase